MSPGLIFFLAILTGVVIGIVGTSVVFLARRNRAEVAALRNPHVPQGVEEVLRALPQTAIVADPSHNVVRASDNAYTSGLVSRPGRLTTDIHDIASRAWQTGNAVEEVVRVPRGPFGSVELTYRVRAALLEPRYVLILATDITESLRVEATRRDFVANVSHELKTPIGAVTLLAEAVKEAADDHDQVQYFSDRMLLEAERLARLTRELIDLSRLQAMDTLEEADDVEVSDIVEQAIELARVNAERKDIRVHAKITEGLVVWGDERLLLMCFQNLITNAITYSPVGSHIGVGARRLGDVIEVSVADRGIGISEDDQKRIFERFYRVDAARSRNTGGTGLGLSIVRHIIENHGGEIRVWSKLGSGSTFTVRLQSADARRSGRDETTESIRLPNKVTS
ncbi:sensor histidine kinase [Gulosibacter sediminis]|uniref:sensor histidine kinase n=1 Tax=Gulosibacter sediminis TaxID=1729695 RepID=UPI0024ACC7EF|nr:ATP-binding protein [Gulosibacter sediminis]